MKPGLCPRSSLGSLGPGTAGCVCQAAMSDQHARAWIGVCVDLGPGSGRGVASPSKESPVESGYLLVNSRRGWNRPASNSLVPYTPHLRLIFSSAAFDNHVDHRPRILADLLSIQVQLYHPSYLHLLLTLKDD